jgi:phosphotransferase system HPr-like phosphotransfer protein
MYWRLEQTVHAERDTIVGPEEGLHARPASQFVKRAKPTEFSLHRRTCPRRSRHRETLPLYNSETGHGYHVGVLD